LTTTYHIPTQGQTGAKSSRRVVLWVFATALALRLVPVLLCMNLAIGLDDMFQYDMLARSLAAGNGYRWYSPPDLRQLQPYLSFDVNSVSVDARGMLTSFRPPLYPFALSLVYRLVDSSEWRFLAARLLNALLGALLPPLILLIGRKAFPGEEKAARLAAYTIAVYPMFMLYPLALATENLFYPLFLLSVLLLLAAAGSRRLWLALTAGACTGLLILTRSVGISVLLAGILWLVLIIRRMKPAVVLLLAALAVVSPWVVRNSLLNGHFTWVENALGYQMYISYHPESRGSFKFGPSLELLSILDDDVRNSTGLKAVAGFVKADPGRVPLLVLNRLGFFFGLERRTIMYFYANNYLGFIPLPLLIVGATVLLLPFVLVATSSAFGLALPYSKNTWLFLQVLLGYLAPHLLIISEERFHMSVVPLLCLLGWRAWLRRGELAALWHTPGRRMLLAVCLLLVAALWYNWGSETVLDWARLSKLFSPTGNQSYFPYE
jgi:4-amino-4-deoxy-L-arabinose transferase-like glycosyltransferase